MKRNGETRRNQLTEIVYDQRKASNLIHENSLSDAVIGKLRTTMDTMRKVMATAAFALVWKRAASLINQTGREARAG